MSKANNRRRRKLIRLDLQLKIVFVTLFVTSLVLLINFQLNLAGLWSLANRFMDSHDTRSLLDAFRSATIHKFLLSVGLAVPLAASVGVLYSFKFCGPIYRFKEYFRSLVNDRWDRKCGLRKGDDLVDVCDMINEAVEVFRSRIRRDHAFFQEVKSLLDANASALENEDTKEQLEALRTEIEMEAESFRRRFCGESDDGSEAEGEAPSSGGEKVAAEPSGSETAPQSGSDEDGQESDDKEKEEARLESQS